MKKINLIFLSLIGSLSISSCTNKNQDSNSQTSSSNQEITNSIEESSSIIDNESGSLENSSSSQELNNMIIDQEKIEIAVNKRFNIRNHLIEPYANPMLIEMIEIQNNEYVDMDSDKALLSFDVHDNIIGKKEGNSTVRVFLDGSEDIYYDIEVSVLNIKDYYLKALDEKTLINKSVTIFGDSISDNSVTAYETNRPNFWVEMLNSTLKMANVYNYAKSGSTIGYSISREKNYNYDFYGTFKVNEATEDLKKSEYAFIFFGANDFCVKETLGNKDDINDNNYRKTESFIGAYYYVIRKIYEANPNIEIVCLSCSYSSWGFVDNYDESTNYAKTRKEMNSIIQSIALDNNASFINVYDLWNQNNMNTYCPDGIHPQTSGYEKIINRLIGKI